MRSEKEGGLKVLPRSPIKMAALTETSKVEATKGTRSDNPRPVLEVEEEPEAASSPRMRWRASSRARATVLSRSTATRTCPVQGRPGAW